MAGILTNIGVLESGKITKPARESFVDDTNALLLNGFNGKIFGLVDLGNPDLQFSGGTYLSDPFTLKPIEAHQEKFPTFHKFFIDTLFERVANMLDLGHATPLAGAGIFDPTFAFPDLPLKPNIGFPELAAALPIIIVPPHPFDLFDIDLTDIDLIAELTSKFPSVSIPTPPTLPDLPTIQDLAPPAIVPPTPDIKIVPPGLPSLPSVPPIHLPNLKVYNILDIIGCIFTAIIKSVVLLVTIKAMDVVLEMSQKLIIGLVAVVAVELLSNIIMCLTGMSLKSVLSFVAAFVVFLERCVAMCCVIIIGQILGSGMLVKSIGQTLHLI